MGQEINRMRNRKFIIALIVFVVLISIICFFPYWFVTHSIVSFSNSGQIGDTIGGIMGPFIAIVASLLTFLAFWVQYEANQDQRKQFKTQDQDQLFFRLMDSQESKIVNSSFTYNDNLISSYQLLEHIVKVFSYELKSECQMLAREVVREKFETLEDNLYQRMFGASNISFLNFEQEKINFINVMRGLDTNERWEHIKNYFGSTRNETEEQLEVLRTIGTFYFYRVDFDIRADIYNVSLQNVNKEYGSFLDGYFKGCEFIAQIINDSENKGIYLQYFLSQMTKYEKVLQFYYLASNKRSVEYLDFAKKNRILDSLFESNGLLIDAPSRDEIEEELQFIFNNK